MQKPTAPLLALVALMLSATVHAQDGGVGDGGFIADAGESGDAGADAGRGDGGSDSEDAGNSDDEDAGSSGDGGPFVDAGQSDAGVDCVPSCTGDTLVFCDDGETVEIDCTLDGARCGLLDEAWGNDCLLPENAVCSPGYAEGRSRCDRAANLTCLEDVCGECPTADCAPIFPPAPPIPGTSGDVPTVPGSEDNALSCLGCTDTPNLPFIALLFGLGVFRWRRERD